MRPHARTPAQAMALGMAMAMAAVSGCDSGPTRVPVRGTVRIDGAPVGVGMVRFVSAQGPWAMSALDKDGRFELATPHGKGCPPGDYVVEVIAREVLGAGAQRWHAPPAYSSAETSKARVTVTGPTDAADVNLTWDGGKPFIQLAGDHGEEKSKKAQDENDPATDRGRRNP